jgi:hypothetical protein
MTLLFWSADGITPAQAYIDPGTGSFLQQGLIALLASGAVLVLSLRDRLARLGGRNRDRAGDAGSTKD